MTAVEIPCLRSPGVRHTDRTPVIPPDLNTARTHVALLRLLVDVDGFPEVLGGQYHITGQGCRERRAMEGLVRSFRSSFTAPLRIQYTPILTGAASLDTPELPKRF